MYYYAPSVQFTFSYIKSFGGHDHGLKHRPIMPLLFMLWQGTHIVSYCRDTQHILAQKDTQGCLLTHKWHAKISRLLYHFDILDLSVIVF